MPIYLEYCYGNFVECLQFRGLPMDVSRRIVDFLDHGGHDRVLQPMPLCGPDGSLLLIDRAVVITPLRQQQVDEEICQIQ